MVTPDKDFAQLVSPTTSMWKPGRKGAEVEVLDDHSVLEQWQIQKHRSSDRYLGTVGGRLR